MGTLIGTGGYVSHNNNNNDDDSSSNSDGYHDAEDYDDYESNYSRFY